MNVKPSSGFTPDDERELKARAKALIEVWDQEDIFDARWEELADNPPPTPLENLYEQVAKAVTKDDQIKVRFIAIPDNSKGRKINGLCNWSNPDYIKISINTELDERQRLDTFLHELSHALKHAWIDGDQPDHDEREREAKSLGGTMKALAKVRAKENCEWSEYPEIDMLGELLKYGLHECSRRGRVE